MLTPGTKGRASPTIDQLRGAIDRGRTGDKVPHPDPAAVPLGTDEEAAGMAPSPAAIKISYADEMRRPLAHDRGHDHWAPAVVAAVAFIAALAIVFVAATA